MTSRRVLPDRVHHVAGDPAVPLFIVVADHRDRGAGEGDVGQAESGANGDREHAGLLGHVTGGVRQQPRHRAVVGLAVVAALDERPARHRRARGDRAGHGALQQIRRLAGDFVLVDMRVAAVGHDDIGVLGHGVGDVGVEVEGDGDGHLGSEARAQPLKQVALGVVAVLGNHGAVQRQDDPVERPLMAGVEHHAAQMRPGRRRGLARGRRPRRDGLHQLPAVAPGGVDMGGDLAGRPAHGAGDLGALVIEPRAV